MDYQFYQQTPPENKKRSKALENAAFILGIIAIITPCVVYPALICGALSIVFALLSRGGELTLTPRAKIGLTLGSIGLAIVILLIVYTLLIAELYYGGFENMARQVYGSMGVDYDALFRSLSQ